MKKEDGGPAFARPVSRGVSRIDGSNQQSDPQQGMSLRDYFASNVLGHLIQANAVYCPSCNSDESSGGIPDMHSRFENEDTNGICSISEGRTIDDKPASWADDLAGDAYGLADAMLKARK